MRVLRDVIHRMVTHGRPPLQCSACGRTRAENNRFISGPGVYLCQTCIEGAPRPLEQEVGPRLRCRFCGEQWLLSKVTQLGEVVACRECLLLMDDILAEAGEERPSRVKAPRP